MTSLSGRRPSFDRLLGLTLQALRLLPVFATGVAILWGGCLMLLGARG